MLNTKYFMAGDQYERNPQAMGNAWFVNGVDYVKGAKAEMIALDSLDVANKAVADQSFSKILGTSQPKTPGDTITLSYYSPDKLSYNARTAKGGVAVFSEVYFPDGWEATIDGKPAEIGRVNYVLRALNVPAGNHHIEFVFAPKALETTNTLSVVGVILVYLFSAGALALVAPISCVSAKKRLRRRRQRKRPPRPRRQKPKAKNLQNNFSDGDIAAVDGRVPVFIFSTNEQSDAISAFLAPSERVWHTLALRLYAGHRGAEAARRLFILRRRVAQTRCYAPVGCCSAAL